MNRYAILAAPIVLCTGLFAQYGTAPRGYYPQSYSGSTFTGIVISTREDEITLSSRNGKKNEEFTGKLETTCSVPRSDKSRQPMKATEIPEGTKLVAFFNRQTKKIDGQKTKENVIIAITFLIFNGKEIADDKKAIFFCTNDQYMQFRFWGDYDPK